MIDIWMLFTILVLACFVGYFVVWGVTPALHSPLDERFQRHFGCRHCRRTDHGRHAGNEFAQNSRPDCRRLSLNQHFRRFRRITAHA